MGWATEDIKDRPIAGTILADTGALLALSGIPVTVVVWAEQLCILAVAQRNALNTDDVEMQRIYVEPGTEIFPFSSMTFSVNERLVIRCHENVDGQIQASILW